MNQNDRSGVSYWGDGHFRLNPRQELCLDVDNTQISIYELAKTIGPLGRPCIVRCPQILTKRVDRLFSAFQNAFSDCLELNSSIKNPEYLGVFPIKVNQISTVIYSLLRSKHPIGLEAGSKVEASIISQIKLPHPKSLKLFNGVKDREFFEIVFSQVLSRSEHPHDGSNEVQFDQDRSKSIIILETLKEVEIYCQSILKYQQLESRTLLPRCGLRLKLEIESDGHWSSSTGADSKFGMSLKDLSRALQMIKESGLEDSVELLHSHSGSQIPHLTGMERAITLLTRYFAELKKSGFNELRYLDVGGGLGIPYTGSSSSSLYSLSYDVQKYAKMVVNTVAKVSQTSGIRTPHIISESGRYLTAHHSFILTDTIPLESERNAGSFFEEGNLSSISNWAKEKKNCDLSFFNQTTLEKHRKDLVTAFAQGEISLADYYSQTALIENADQDPVGLRSINLSVFQSLPDAWSIKQTLPVVPLTDSPTQNGHKYRFVDLTCDSDGQIQSYASSTGPNNYCWSPYLDPKKTYTIGVFLTGAYQDILGDRHNLFGKISEYEVLVNSDLPNGFALKKVTEAESVLELGGIVRHNLEQNDRDISSISPYIKIDN